MKMRPARVLLSLACALLLPCFEVSAQSAAKRGAARPPANPVTERFRAEKLAEIDAAIAQNISSNRLPGGVLWLERDGAAYHRAYGQRAVFPKREQMTEDTIFDAASLTKVIATAPSIMILAERGKLRLDDSVAKFIPDFATNNKGAITIQHLLTHTSGLRPGISPGKTRRRISERFAPWFKPPALNPAAC